MKNLLSLSLLALATSVFAQSSASVSENASDAPASVSPTTTAPVAAVESGSSASRAGTGSRTGSKASEPTPKPAPVPVTGGTVSQSCAAFLTKFNKDSEINSCLSPLLSAANAAAGANGAALAKALDSFCKAPGCSDVTIRTQLTAFQDACEQELTGSNPNEVVRLTYDALYTSNPMRDALCSKDGADYCVAKLKTSTVPAISSAVAEAKNGLYGEAKAIGLPDSQIVLTQTPNTGVWRSTSLANLFISPDLDPKDLCTPCTATILKSYSQFGIPHALGAPNSPLLGGQVEIWKAINDKCDASFSQGIFDASVLVTQNSGSTGSGANLAGFALSFVVVAASAWFSL